MSWASHRSTHFIYGVLTGLSLENSREVVLVTPDSRPAFQVRFGDIGAEITAPEARRWDFRGILIGGVR